ncbi:DsrE/DsrF/TusD sulfur relay family protein [Aliidiomarina halalkaliphila]|nr:DsrE family protein [Aliidiomarina halalkaliphila]
MAAAHSIVLMIYSGPDYFEPGLRALADARRLTKAGSTIRQVFFYGAATLYGSAHIEFPSGLPNLQEEWRQFSAATQSPLVICSTAGAQYGVIAEPAPEGNLAEGFFAGGLAEFVEQLSSADQLLQY